MQKRQKEGYGDTVDSPPAGEERCREAVKYIAHSVMSVCFAYSIVKS